MVIKLYLKIFFGSLLAMIIMNLVFALFAIGSVIGLVLLIIKNILFLIFHPIRFFKERKNKNPVKTTVKDLLGVDWKDFIDNEKKEKLVQSTNSFTDMLNVELAKMRESRRKEKNNDSENK